MNWKDIIKAVELKYATGVKSSGKGCEEADISTFADVFDLPGSYSEEFSKRMLKY